MLHGHAYRYQDIMSLNIKCSKVALLQCELQATILSNLQSIVSLQLPFTSQSYLCHLALYPKQCSTIKVVLNRILKNNA